MPFGLHRLLVTETEFGASITRALCLRNVWFNHVCLHGSILCRYYGEAFPAAGQKDVAILDLCSSWISHYPKGYTAGRIAGDHQSTQPQAFDMPVCFTPLANTRSRLLLHVTHKLH